MYYDYSFPSPNSSPEPPYFPILPNPCFSFLSLIKKSQKNNTNRKLAREKAQYPHTSAETHTFSHSNLTKKITKLKTTL